MYFSMDDDGDVLARPTPVVEVRPQRGVLRHTVEHIIDVLPYVQVLMCLLVDVLQKIDTLTPEQVIEVPKILPDRVPHRIVERRPPQMAEQLVEVPAVVSFVEQNVDIPVRRNRGAQGGRQGFPPGQGSAQRAVELIVNIPGGGLQGFFPRQGSLQRTVEQIVDILLAEVFTDLGQVSTASSSFLDGADEVFQGFFALFTIFKKSAQSGRQATAGVVARSSSWTPAAYEPGEPSSEEKQEDPNIWVDAFGRTWMTVRTATDTLPGSWTLVGTCEAQIFWDAPG